VRVRVNGGDADRHKNLFNQCHSESRFIGMKSRRQAQPISTGRTRTITKLSITRDLHVSVRDWLRLTLLVLWGVGDADLRPLPCLTKLFEQDHLPRPDESASWRTCYYTINVNTTRYRNSSSGRTIPPLFIIPGINILLFPPHYFLSHEVVYH